MTVASASARPGTPATLRELEVLTAWRDLDGDLDAVAAKLYISPHTVRNHLANARARANCRRTWQAVRALISA